MQRQGVKGKEEARGEVQEEGKGTRARATREMQGCGAREMGQAPDVEGKVYGARARCTSKGQSSKAREMGQR